MAQHEGSAAQQLGSQPPQQLVSQQLWQQLLQRRKRPAKAASGRIRCLQQLWQHESQQLSQVLQQETGAQQVVSQHGLAQQVCSQQVGAQHDEAQQRPNRPALASWLAKNDKAATANKAMTRDFMGISPNLGGD